MATNTAGTNARSHPIQHVHYFRRTVAYNTAGIATGVSLGTLPAGAQLLQCLTIPKTAFNGTDPSLTVGTVGATYNNIKADGGETTTAAVIGTAASFLTFTQDTEVFIRFINASTTVTPSSAGSATIVLSYVPDNDQ